MTGRTFRLARPSKKNNIDVPNMRHCFGMRSRGRDVAFSVDGAHPFDWTHQISRQVQKVGRVGKKIIDPAVSGFPIRARRLCDLTGAFHFDRKQVRLGKAMTECGIIIERVVACDRMRPRPKGLCCFYSRQKTPIAPYGKNLFWRHQ